MGAALPNEATDLIDGLYAGDELTRKELVRLLKLRSKETMAYAAQKADEVRRRIYGTDVYVRGLIEFSSYCKNDCYYCGIRCSNAKAQRYRLLDDEIFGCVDIGYELGYRTFVLQSGEDPYYTDEHICDLVRGIKRSHPDCAVTLSIGEKEHDSYQAYFDAGADRYLLRHETIDDEHYSKLHPAQMSREHRVKCLYDLMDIGYQVGCGIMVGSPCQTPENIADDLLFMKDFKPHMVGVGPFIPATGTPFENEAQGSVDETLYLISIIRLLLPKVLLPATTALGTANPVGRELGIKAGANVVMPNISPTEVRDKYTLYDNKICTGDEAPQCKDCLSARVAGAGYRMVLTRGDHPDME